MSLFSVVTPTYNDGPIISKAINSILKQKFQDWELIIVDDGSTDNTEEIVKEYTNDSRVHYFKQENKGVSQARNAGIKRAKGSFITFLDSDDSVNEDWLQDFYELWKSSQNAGYISCGYYINEDAKFPKLDPKISSERYSSLAGTFAIKNEILQKLGGYDTNLKQSENWELTARALEYCRKNGLEIVHTNKCNFSYNHNPTPAQTRVRDEYRAEATYYLYKKYGESGVFHYRKDEFLVSSGVNFLRAGKIKKSRKIFYKILFNNPSMENLSRIIMFEIPPLRKKKWGRK